MLYQFPFFVNMSRVLSILAIFQLLSTTAPMFLDQICNRRTKCFIITFLLYLLGLLASHKARHALILIETYIAQLRRTFYQPLVVLVMQSTGCVRVCVRYLCVYSNDNLRTK